jgi:REP element-mobilizing transposase RayT
MPEHVKMLGNLRTDYNRNAKPQLDTYQYEEIDEVIREAMEENNPVKISVWQDGFTSDICGKVHYVDLLKQQLQIEVQPGEFERVKMEDIV